MTYSVCNYSPRLQQDGMKADFVRLDSKAGLELPATTLSFPKAPSSKRLLSTARRRTAVSIHCETPEAVVQLVVAGFDSSLCLLRVVLLVCLARVLRLLPGLKLPMFVRPL